MPTTLMSTVPTPPRRKRWLIATLVILLLGLAAAAGIGAVWLLGGNDEKPRAELAKAAGLGKFAVSAGAPAARPLGEIGPGACWPGDERPKGGKLEGFATSDGPIHAATWLRAHPDIAKRLDRHLAAHLDYYLVRAVVPGWNTLPPTERTARYVAKMVAVKVTAPIQITNTYCKGGNVVVWEVQVLPVDEWIYFIPGHGPGTEDPRPAFKGVCGNPLLPPLQPKKPVKPGHPTTSTPPRGCEHTCMTPPPTSPPHAKDPFKDPAPRGNAPVGGGKNADPGPGTPKPYTPPPAAPYSPPAPPVPTSSPTGSTPTQINTPPPETEANPPGGGGNTGDPGGF